jgi:hypothetical protein
LVGVLALGACATTPHVASDYDKSSRSARVVERTAPIEQEMVAGVLAVSAALPAAS